VDVWGGIMGRVFYLSILFGRGRVEGRAAASGSGVGLMRPPTAGGQHDLIDRDVMLTVSNLRAFVDPV
jgi:hypothetical protein